MNKYTKQPTNQPNSYQNMDEQINEQNQNQQQQQYQPLPEFGQVQGQQIYLYGLDYKLLQKQKQQQNKRPFMIMDKIRQKLNIIQQKHESNKSSNLNIGKTTTNNSSSYNIFQSSIDLISTIKQINYKPLKSLINKQTYYLFDIRKQFGKQLPQILIKRSGRFNKEQSIIKVNQQIIKKITMFLENKDKLGYKQNDKMLNQMFNINNIDNNNGNNNDQSQDDIFGNDSDQNQSQTDNKQSQKSQKLFNFGKPLDLGTKNNDIFTHIRNKKQTKTIQQQQKLNKIKQNSIEPQKDKYQFLRKKVKININQQQNDGYTECYYQSGPTFDQMKQYKAQGIEIWGDLKQQQKKPERKVNIHKDYEKVKKIIQEKYNKK